MKIHLVTLAWLWFGLWCAAAVTLSAVRLLNKQWIPGLLLAVIGVAAIVMVGLYLSSVRRLGMPLAGDSGDRIVMRVSSDARATWIFWAASALIAAGALVEFPDVLWTRWLSYPASLVPLALCGLLLWIAWIQEFQQVIADAQGIELRSEMARGATSDSKVAWAQVGAVKRVEVYLKKAAHRGPDQFERREFVLLDRNGAELLNLEDPLDPPERYQRFLAAVPHWTGLPVQEVRVTK